MSSPSFSGQECWVYVARDPSELAGHHAQLINSSLQNARARYLIYSPRRDAGGAPFDLPPQSGSHAIAVTDDSLIISRDAHRAEDTPTVATIPFRRIHTIELGEALTLGWLRVRFADLDARSQIVYFNSTGIGMFREAVRQWMRRLRPVPVKSEPAAPASRLLDGGPAYLTAQLLPLLDPQSMVLLERGSEEWRQVGRRLVCVSGVGLLAVTDDAVFLVESERPLRQGMHVFGVNVRCVPREAVTAARIRVCDAHNDKHLALSLSIVAGGVVTNMISHFNLGAKAIDRIASAFDVPTGVITRR